MKFVKKHDKTLAFLPTWRLLIVLGMYCATAVQIGAWIIFTIEQKPIHPIGHFLLILGSATTSGLGHFIGKRDLRLIREHHASLECTPIQCALIIICCASVPAALLALVIISSL